MPDETPNPVTVTVTTEPITLPKDFSATDVALVANELAMNVHTEAVICAKHGLNDDQLKLLKTLDIFKAIYEPAVIEYAKVTSVNKRVSLGAALLVEKILPEFGARLTQKIEPLQSVVAGVKVLSDMAGLGADKNNPNANSERVTITINLGDDTISLNKSKSSVETVTAEAIQVNPKRVGDGSAVREDTKGQGADVTVRTLPAPSGSSV